MIRIFFNGLTFAAVMCSTPFGFAQAEEAKSPALDGCCIAYKTAGVVMHSWHSADSVNATPLTDSACRDYANDFLGSKVADAKYMKRQAYDIINTQWVQNNRRGQLNTQEPACRTPELLQ